MMHLKQSRIRQARLELASVGVDSPEEYLLQTCQRHCDIDR